MKISELAKSCDVNKETIRYYERKGMIPEPPRTQSGYRVYSEDIADRVRFIKRMQELDFTLKEIHLLLGVVDQDGKRCKDMYDFTVRKIKDIEQKVQDLLRMKQMLQELKEKCPDEKAMYACPIIEKLMEKSNENDELGGFQ